MSLSALVRSLFTAVWRLTLCRQPPLRPLPRSLRQRRAGADGLTTSLPSLALKGRVPFRGVNPVARLPCSLSDQANRASDFTPLEGTRPRLGADAAEAVRAAATRVGRALDAGLHSAQWAGFQSPAAVVGQAEVLTRDSFAAGLGCIQGSKDLGVCSLPCTGRQRCSVTLRLR